MAERDNDGGFRGSEKIAMGVLLIILVLLFAKYWERADDSLVARSVFYNIINSSDETMLDTTTDTRRPPLQTWHPKPENVAQRWEFIPPVVAVPPGWVQIQNASTGRVLSHKYLSQQPVLIAPSALQPSHYRESW